MTATLPEFSNQIFYHIERASDNSALDFYSLSAKHISMYHEQDCCESVWLDDVNGSLDYLIDTPILSATVKTEDYESDEGSGTYTFYTFRTRKGTVDLTWRGESNGFYSESVDIFVYPFPITTDIRDKYLSIHPEFFI